MQTSLQLLSFRALLILLSLAGSACRSERTVNVRVSIPGPDGALSPASGVALVALPYDRDSVIRALDAKAPTPRPSTAILDSLYLRFREPFTAFAAATFAAEQARDSLERIRRQLDSLPRDNPDYARLFATWERLAGQRTRFEHTRDSVAKRLDAARRAFGPAADSARAALRAWEDSTYRGYEEITSMLARQQGRQPVSDTTGADGSATLTLKGGGRWWIYARSWDATDPNAEWYWNVPVKDREIVLDPQHGVRRARY